MSSSREVTPSLRLMFVLCFLAVETLMYARAATKDVTGEEAPVDFFPGYTDTAVIAATTGNRNCMSYGPGDLFYAHKPDEFVELDDITRCTRVMTRLAESILIDA